MGCLYLYLYLTKKQVCVQPTVNSAVDICCCAPCCGAAAAGRQAPAAVNRYVPACRTLSSKPAARRSGCRTMGQTDRRTDRRPTVTQTLLRILCRAVSKLTRRSIFRSLVLHLSVAQRKNVARLRSPSFHSLAFAIAGFRFGVRNHRSTLTSIASQCTWRC